MPALPIDRSLAHARDLMESGDPAAAAALLRPLIAKVPGHAFARYLLGRALMYQGFLDDAERELAAAASLTPKDAGIWISLGALRRQTDDRPGARAAFARALALTDPRDSETLMKLGESLAELGDPVPARAAFEKAIAAEPLRPEPLAALTQLSVREGRTREAADGALRAAALAGTNAHALFLTTSPLNYAGHVSPEQVREAHARFGRAAEASGGPVAPHTNTPDPERRLRIGYVSADFCRHSVSFYIEPIIEGHNRQQFEVFLYSNTPHEDEVTARIAALDVQWRPVVGLSDEDLALQIRAEQIDILVDLSGHTTGSRIIALAKKPAPIQATYLGYPNTTGLSRIDYRLVDALTDPPDAPPVATETLERLPGCFLCYRPAFDAPPVAPLDPAAPVTFGSFNNLAKFDDLTLDLWSRTLLAVPGSRLLLKSGGLDLITVRDALLARFLARGIDSGRIEILPRADLPADHLAQYARVGIGLDTFPYHGTTTTCEALWQGVPVVCMTGWSHASRVGASLLSAIGLPELIATTPDEFVKIAVALANDTPRLAALRAGLRQRMFNSPLLDEPGFIATLESVYRRWWREWCARTA